MPISQKAQDQEKAAKGRFAVLPTDILINDHIVDNETSRIWVVAKKMTHMFSPTGVDLPHTKLNNVWKLVSGFAERLLFADHDCDNYDLLTEL